VRAWPHVIHFPLFNQPSFCSHFGMGLGPQKKLLVVIDWKKEKDGNSIYIVPFILCIVWKHSNMDNTVLPANTPCLPFLCKRSPDGATPNWGCRHPIAVYYSFIYRPRRDERLSWPDWLTYSGWLTRISGHLSATGWAQDRESSPVLPLCHATKKSFLSSNQQLPKHQRELHARVVLTPEPAVSSYLLSGMPYQ